MITDFDELYGGKYLTAADIKNPRTAKIERVEHTEFSRAGEPVRKKAVVHFMGAKKPMVLNKTNAFTIASAFSKDFNAWIGKQVRIQAEMVNFAGKSTQGLRVYPIAPGTEPAPEPAPVKAPAPVSDDLNDEIPW